MFCTNILSDYYNVNSERLYSKLQKVHSGSTIKESPYTKTKDSWCHPSLGFRINLMILTFLCVI